MASDPARVAAENVAACMWPAKYWAEMAARIEPVIRAAYAERDREIAEALRIFAGTHYLPDEGMVGHNWQDCTCGECEAYRDGEMIRAAQAQLGGTE
jgi:hypothetical protein